MTESPETTSKSDDPTAHLRWLETEIEWNKKHLESVERDRSRSPFLLVGFVIAIPVGIFFGWFKALLVVLGSIALLISALYLTTGHILQYREKIADLEKKRKDAARIAR